jgi:hypothetical protein
MFAVPVERRNGRFYIGNGWRVESERGGLEDREIGKDEE